MLLYQKLFSYILVRVKTFSCFHKFASVLKMLYSVYRLLQLIFLMRMILKKRYANIKVNQSVNSAATDLIYLLSRFCFIEKVPHKLFKFYKFILQGI